MLNNRCYFYYIWEEKDQPKKSTLTRKSELVKESHPDPEPEPLKRNTTWSETQAREGNTLAQNPEPKNHTQTLKPGTKKHICYARLCCLPKGGFIPSEEWMGMGWAEVGAGEGKGGGPGVGM